MNNRIIHIDIAKGMGILFVVLGHNWIVIQDGQKGEAVVSLESSPNSRALVRPGVEVEGSSVGGCIQPKEQMDKVFKPFYTTKPKGVWVGPVLAKQ